ncbi:MAG: hypothetical protein V1647_07075 [Pseudomonadota bacterium]
MKYSLIKWIGTLIIIAVGLYIAANMTYKWKVSEDTVYKLNLPEYTFMLRDGRNMALTMSMVFKTKQAAKDAETSRLVLVDLFNTIFKDVDSSSINNVTEIEVLKTKVMIELKKAKYPVLYVSFDTNPKLL